MNALLGGLDTELYDREKEIFYGAAFDYLAEHGDSDNPTLSHFLATEAGMIALEVAAL